jgi:hypothetical protein
MFLRKILFDRVQSLNKNEFTLVLDHYIKYQLDFVFLLIHPFKKKAKEYLILKKIIIRNLTCALRSSSVNTANCAS